MPTSVWATEVAAVLEAAAHTRTTVVSVGNRQVEIPKPFPSPTDWRDVWIYQIMLDRFCNPDAGPAHPPWDSTCGKFQGGTLNGVRAQLDYLQQLGVGAIWLSPVMKNCQYCESYHGYGIQDFLALDPRFASDPETAKANPQLVEGEFTALVEEAHARGIRVIADVVLNHAGDVFEYAGYGSEAPWSGTPYGILWRDETGRGQPDLRPDTAGLSPDAAVWPVEFFADRFFRRQGRGGETGGDFCSLKEMVTGLTDFNAAHGYHYPVRDALIRAHAYFAARYDVDGFRIDTLKFVEPEFGRTFANAIREMALTIGKENFLTFGEVYDSEETIARFIGRSANATGEPIGVDAALDFPLFYHLPQAVKGSQPPGEVVRVFEHRKQVQQGLLSTHGDASRYFVTFLDNHDQAWRFYYRDPADPHRWDDQVTMGLACLFSLQGIPCIYYGTEQGLCGTQERYQQPDRDLGPEAVREALWGKDAPAFADDHPFYRALQELASLRRATPTLRYGRQYFRPLSGDGVHFGISWFQGGTLSFSRILNEEEVLVLANTSSDADWQGDVIVDFSLNPVDASYEVMYTNKDRDQLRPPGRVVEKPAGGVTIQEVDATVTDGPVRTVRVFLRPLEVQFLRKPRA